MLSAILDPNPVMYLAPKALLRAKAPQFERIPGEPEAAEELSGAILDACLEHGVGVDKSRYMPKMFSADDLDTMQLVRCAFDPASLCNPGKVFPTPRLCGEVPGHHRGVHPAVAAGQVEIF